MAIRRHGHPNKLRVLSGDKEGMVDMCRLMWLPQLSCDVITVFVI